MMKAELFPIVTIKEAMECARLMASVDPWLTLKKSYEDCLKLFLNRSHDIFIMKDDDKVIAFCVVETNAFTEPVNKLIAVHPDYRDKGIEKRMLENMQIQNNDKGVYASGNRNEMDIDFIYNNLKNLYWATNLTRENLMGRMMNSMCFGIFVNGQQKGFARVVTDYFSFAYLADVFVEEKERGKGYSRILMEYILDYPSLRDIKWLLATRDMHRLYEKYGFAGIANPDRFMGRERMEIILDPCSSSCSSLLGVKILSSING